MTHLCQGQCECPLVVPGQAGSGVKGALGDKLGALSQMGTLHWVKPALQRTLFPTVNLHTSIQAELRVLLTKLQRDKLTHMHSHIILYVNPRHTFSMICYVSWISITHFV